MASTVFTGWHNVTPGPCSVCGMTDDYECDGRGTVYCSCQCCASCGMFDGHETGCDAANDDAADDDDDGGIGAIEADADESAHGCTFAEWLTAAGRADSASEYDLRAAWRAGEDPAEYR